MAIRALKMAIALRRPPKYCIHHSDRGRQYCLHDYLKTLRQHGFKVFLSGKGNGYPSHGSKTNRAQGGLRATDNAAVETFIKTINAELIWRHSWQARAVKIAIFEYINGFYNPRRRRSALA